MKLPQGNFILSLYIHSVGINIVVHTLFQNQEEK